MTTLLDIQMPHRRDANAAQKIIDPKQYHAIAQTLAVPTVSPGFSGSSRGANRLRTWRAKPLGEKVREPRTEERVQVLLGVDVDEAGLWIDYPVAETILVTQHFSHARIGCHSNPSFVTIERKKAREKS